MSFRCAHGRTGRLPTSRGFRLLWAPAVILALRYIVRWHDFFFPLRRQQTELSIESDVYCHVSCTRCPSSASASPWLLAQRPEAGEFLPASVLLSRGFLGGEALCCLSWNIRGRLHTLAGPEQSGVRAGLPLMKAFLCLKLTLRAGEVWTLSRWPKINWNMTYVSRTSTLIWKEALKSVN